jgi:hypothetical protein
MASLTYPLPSGRAPRGESFLNALFSAFQEGFGKARRYQTLARKSDAELEQLGIDRDQLPRIVMFGK